MGSSKKAKVEVAGISHELLKVVHVGARVEATKQTDQDRIICQVEVDVLRSDAATSDKDQFLRLRGAKCFSRHINVEMEGALITQGLQIP